VATNDTFTSAGLRTPGAAAIAGLLFSFLLLATFVLLRISVPPDPQEPGSWLRANSGAVELAMNLVPFAGIAFLWFIGVLRDRLGQLEDRFFATVFFGSGLLFLGTLFLASAITGGIIIAFAAKPGQLIGSATYHFARAAAYAMMNIYVVKMACVFMITSRPSRSIPRSRHAGWPSSAMSSPCCCYSAAPSSVGALRSSRRGYCC
jgi:hypothetical protein